ncbi:drebrin-like [Rhea pennata]|uniref:drebrin-like n=1 Tax=Rhea pennata TaxID=8795 RepID=UPI002E25619F
MGAPGLERHRLALLAAREDVGNPRTATNWAAFAYERHHDLKLLDSGAGGPEQLAGKFSVSSVMYGLCRVPDPSTGVPRVILISWVGEQAPESQRQACAGHLPAIRAFFREASAVLSARRTEEVTQEGLQHALAQLAPARAPAAGRGSPPDAQEPVGTNYQKTNAALEIRRTERDSFWAQAEREEQQRKEAERRRELEQQQRWEQQRREQERREAAARELRCQEKERLVEEQRKEQARLEAQERAKDGARGEQRREHREATRDSGEKAAEAAAQVSQRMPNPWDFFRQWERSAPGAPAPASLRGPRVGRGPTGAGGRGAGAGHPPSPLSRAAGARQPVLRNRRSLTESAYIFRRPEPPGPPGAPCSSSGIRSPTPGATPGTPSPTGAGPPPPASPTGTRSPTPGATPGTPSPTGAGPPPPASPTGTRSPPPGATPGTPSPTGAGPPPSCLPHRDQVPHTWCHPRDPQPDRGRTPPSCLPHRDQVPPAWCHPRDPQPDWGPPYLCHPPWARVPRQQLWSRAPAPLQHPWWGAAAPGVPPS